VRVDLFKQKQTWLLPKVYDLVDKIESNNEHEE